MEGHLKLRLQSLYKFELAILTKKSNPEIKSKTYRKRKNPDPICLKIEIII